MKTTIFNLAALLALLVLGNYTHAQNIITTCGGDTITLRAANHQMGTLEWEKSYNNESWMKIPNAQDTIYKFYPTEAAYYRVVNKLPYCDPTISTVTRVLFPPQANAGADRIAVDDVVFLQGNTSMDATYSWSILEGVGGEIVDPNNRSTQFNGSHVGVNGSDGNYTLLYTLQNACGISTDTMKIEFLTNVWYDEIVIVDDTDLILSTPAQIENGQYIITFSSPVPNITNQTILLGIQDEGFMRKVVQITQNGNTFDMMTEQAKIDELILSGGLDMAHLLNVDPVNETVRASIGEEKFLTEKPTRQQLQAEARFQNPNAVHYYFVEDIEEGLDGVNFSRSTNTDRNDRVDNITWLFSFDNTVLIDTLGLKAQLDGGFSFTPNLMADVKFGLTSINKVQVGVENALFNFNAQFSCEGEISGSTQKTFTLKTIHRVFLVVVGPVAIPIKTKIQLNADAGLSVSGSFEYNYEYEKNYQVNAGIIYNQGNWITYFSDTTWSKSEQDYNAQASVTASMDVGPKIFFSVAGLNMGAYVDLKMTSDLTACASTQNNQDFNWGLNFDLGGKLTPGVHAYMFKKKIFDKSHTWQNRKMYNDRFPHFIQYWAGNNQQYTIGQPTENTLSVRVLSKQGYIIPGAFVAFEPIDNGGTVSNPFAFTNSSGIASTSWTPTSSNLSRVRAWVKNCDFSYIEYAPLIFTATDITPNNDCSETTLSASNLVVDDNLTIIPHLGLPPYTYSSDLVNFSSTPVEVPMQPNYGYAMAIKDAQGCIAHTYYLNYVEDCPSNSIELFFDIYGTHGFVAASGGTPPYTYQLNGGIPFTSQFFTGLPEGTHTMSVIDANACLQTSNFEISTTSDQVMAFFMTPDSVDFGVTVSPFNLSANATSYLWNFGNGQTSTAASPSVTYTAGGDYVISLTASSGGVNHVYERLITVGQNPDWLTDGLVAHYPFNGNANDESGNNNHGTVYGATLTEDRHGNPNSAYQFDGNSYITTPNLQNNVTEYTISAWINTNNLSQTVNLLTSRAPINDGNPGICCSSARGILLGFTNGNLSYGLNADFINIGVQTTANIQAGNWYHIVGVFEGLSGESTSNTYFKLFVNGVLVQTSLFYYNPQNQPTTIPLNGSNFGTKIGKFYEELGFSGRLDDIRIYNRVLNQYEIQQLLLE